MKLKKMIAALTALVCCTATGAMFPKMQLPVSAESTIANPFIWADVPDEDVIRVGNTYYMVSTTMFFSPVVPVMKSNDLVSWEICNYVCDTYADGDKQNLVGNEHDYAHGQWATSLRYKDGVFYVFFGSYGTGKSYIYKTTDIENGKWERSEINGMYHDASMLLDDDGRNYLVYGGGGEIKIKELNSEMTGFKDGATEQTLLKTGLDNLAGEGSHIQKIGDYYYIFLIAWPSTSGRIELCYRSKSLLGSYEGKTVLNSGVGTYGSGVAQGGIVETPSGDWYGVLFQDHGSVGRIPVLVPVTWQNGWPMMGVNGKAPVTLTIDGDYKGTQLAKDDDFSYSSNKLALEWQWNHNPDNTAWSVTERDGWLRLHNAHIAKSIMNARNTLTMRTEGPACSSVIRLDSTGMKAGDCAGLSAFQFNYGNVGVRVDDFGGKYVYMAKNGAYSGNSAVVDSYDNIIEQVPMQGDIVYLKEEFEFNTVDSSFNVSNNIDNVNFFYSYDGNNWTKIGETLNMTYDLKLFTGYRSAIYSYPTKSTGGYADIDFFDYERADWNLPNVIEPDANGWYFHSTFEGSLDDWNGRGAVSLLTSGRTAYEGAESLLISERSASWNGASKKLTAPFKAGETYSFSANVMYFDGGATDTFYMKLQYTGADGKTYYDSIAEGMASKGEWIQLSNTEYTIPADATNMELYLETAESKNNFYADDIVGAVAGTVVSGAGKGSARDVILGDVNGDGVVNVIDVALAKRGILKGFPNSFDEQSADVDQSGKVDTTDIALIQKFVSKKITAFPEPEQPDNMWDNYIESASPDMQAFYQSAIYQYGNTSRLWDKVQKAQSGKPVTVAYIGGSITEGNHAPTCYAQRSFDYFADTFGTGNNCTFINAGMSGTSSVVGLMRAQRDILDAKPDVIFVEFSVNDHPEEVYKKSYESLVKKCLSQENAPAVILIINRAKGGYSMQEQMAEVGKYYDIPVISMDNALTKAFNSGLLTTDDYYTDEYHPHEKGCALIADSIAYFYRQALKTEHKSGAYTVPTGSAYGNEYTDGSIVPTASLSGFNSGSFKEDNSNTRFGYGFTFEKYSNNTPMTFKTKGRGIFIVFKSNQNSSLGVLNVTVNGKTTKINGNKLYAWGGADADVAYMQDVSGDLDVSISMENAGSDFTIWGIGVVK